MLPGGQDYWLPLRLAEIPVAHEVAVLRTYPCVSQESSYDVESDA
jgi:hypothetical protein